MSTTSDVFDPTAHDACRGFLQVVDTAPNTFFLTGMEASDPTESGTVPMPLTTMLTKARLGEDATIQINLIRKELLEDVVRPRILCLFLYIDG